MRIAAYFLAGAIGLLGLVFVIAAGQGNAIVRITIGLVCIAAAAAIVALARLQPIQQSHTHHKTLHLSGDVSLEKLNCRQCGAGLNSQSVRIEAGAVFVHCEFCGAQYQLEEAPKW